MNVESAIIITFYCILIKYDYFPSECLLFTRKGNYLTRVSRESNLLKSGDGKGIWKEERQQESL